MATLRLFASIREVAGTRTVDIDGETVGEVLDAARDKFGPDFEAILATCRVWVNGEPADDTTVVSSRDEIGVLPPVSGG